MNQDQNLKPALWGGIECTINRVNDVFTDQSELAGWYSNEAMLDAATSLPFQKFRFPILWEKHQPGLDTEIDWSFTSNALSKLSQRSIEPIAGLLHHGSGPGFTNLLDEQFPYLFASYAAKVAKQFPFINYYTPINEPLTTARFSGLYGLWYPHKKNDVSFIRMLLIELKATVLAMSEIRKINPGAKFVQTEDLGKTYSTSLLSYQANFENERRWLTYDILCGRFNQDHKLWQYFIRLGIDVATMQFFLDNPTPPDIVGVNYYATSERFLDHRVDKYPGVAAGGNGVHNYVDVEAVRVPLKTDHGIEVLLKEIWQRYELPLVITEVHLHCTREEQLRWLNEVYSIACKLKLQGLDLQAITVWALLGSYGWNKLLTSFPGDYETGTFDISAGYPRETAIAGLVKSLAAEEPSPRHLLQHMGWWKHESRFLHSNAGKQLQLIEPVSNSQPLLIVADTAETGRLFRHVCKQRNLAIVILSQQEFDGSDMLCLLSTYAPWGIIFTYTGLSDMKRQRSKCVELAKLCEQRSVKFTTIKMGSLEIEELVTGGIGMPFTISEEVTVKAHSTQKIDPGFLSIQLPAYCWSPETAVFSESILSHVRTGEQIWVDDLEQVTTVPLAVLLHASLDLVIDDAKGNWLVTTTAAISTYAFAQLIASREGLDATALQPKNRNQPCSMRLFAGQMGDVQMYKVTTPEDFSEFAHEPQFVLHNVHHPKK